MTGHHNEDELVEGMSDLSLMSKSDLIAALVRSKKKCRALADEVQILDNQNRDYKAALDESEKKAEGVEKKVEMYEDCLDIAETAKAGEQVKGKEKVDAMEVDEVEEKEEQLVVCKFWAQLGRCRYGYEGSTCEHGFHPPKEGSKVASAAEAKKELAL